MSAASFLRRLIGGGRGGMDGAVQNLLKLCDALIGESGEYASTALACETVEAYQALDERSLFLGQFAHAQYTNGTMTLRAGDRLVFYTDGIPEAMSSDGDYFEDERLQAAVAAYSDLDAGPFADALLADVAFWTGPQAQADDITVVVLDVAAEG